MAYDEDVAERVWAETRRLVVVAPSAEADLRRLQAALGLAAGKLAAGPTRKAAFPAREDAPRVTDKIETALFNAMTAAIESGAGGSYAGVPLPGVVALVKLTAADKPDPPDGGFPKWLATVIDAGATPSAVFTFRDDRSGRRYGIYERLAAAGEGEQPLVSDVTGTGTTPPKPRRTLVSTAGWILVAVAFVVALVSAVSIWGQGAHLARTYAIIDGSDRAGFDKLVALSDCTVTTKIAALCNGTEAVQGSANLSCLQELPQTPTTAPPAGPDVTVALPFEGDPPPGARYKADAPCRELWRAARSVEREATKFRLPEWLPNWIEKQVNGVTAPGAEGPALFWPLIGLFAGILALGGAVGLGGYGRLFGLWINNQNRFSLSTAQVCMWTALVIAPFGAVTLLHTGMRLGGETSPKIPGLLFSLMGITFGSTMLSKYILLVKSASPQDRNDDGIGRYIGNSWEGLARNASPRQATILDFFSGEEESNRNQLDASRFQNVVFTFVLGACYFAAVIAMFERADVAAVLGAFVKPQRLYGQMPEITGSFLGLLLVSHAAYLTIKAAPKDKPETERGASGTAAR